MDRHAPHVTDHDMVLHHLARLNRSPVEGSAVTVAATILSAGVLVAGSALAVRRLLRRRTP